MESEQVNKKLKLHKEQKKFIFILQTEVFRYDSHLSIKPDLHFN